MRWWLPLMGLWVAGLVQAGERAANASAWLDRVQQAAVHTSYQGTLVVNVGGHISSTRVLHVAQGDEPVERIDWLDGVPRSTVREAGEVITLWPEAKVALVEPRRAQTRFPSLLAGQDVAGVLGSYALKPAGRERVAGRDADVMVLKARDALRYSQRLWADQRTGLLLRSEWLDAGGQVLESTAFIELVLSGTWRAADVSAPARRLAGWRVLRPPVQATDLAREGWALNPLPDGFSLVDCARRVANPMGDATKAATVVQAIYSDGVTHVSVFIEPVSPGRRVEEGSHAQGVTHVHSRREGAHWITVMGDVPPATIAAFSNALVRKP